MNHISIEGMDGVGKSTTCKLLAERLGYIFVEKPLHYLLDDSDDEIKQYQKVAKRVNANPNRNFTAWYYGLNNIYLYEKFKDTHPELPVIFLSGDPSEESIIKGLNLGAEDFIVKPVSLRELVARIKNKISNKQIQLPPERR